MKLVLTRDWVWIGINGLVAVVFLLLSLPEWLEPELKDVPGASGGAPVVFISLVVWLVSPLLALNVIWLVTAICLGKQQGDWFSRIRLFGLMAFAWVCLVLFSASRV